MEDNAADVFLIRAALEKAKIQANLHILKDGEQAIQFFDAVDGNPAFPCPALVVLDINLPKRHGGEVLRHMRESPRCGRALVIAVSTSDSAQDRDEMASLGANGYFRKPSEYADFMKLGDLIQALLNAAR